MSTTLRGRAKAFLQRPIPKDMKYVPGSLAEGFISQYAEEGHLTLDAELAEMLELVVADYGSNDKWNPGEREYLTESHEILESILQEERGRPTWPG